MDYSMPVCDGPTATKAIREFLTESGYPREKQPIICCVSAYSELNYKNAALDSGMDCFLSKPIFYK